jgi:hypothetical protein
MRTVIISLALLLLCLPVASSVYATTYQGRANTGYRYGDKRTCCEHAIYLAQQDSARACERTGGYPDYRHSSARGNCKWDMKGSGRSRVYGCTATSKVLCN